MFLERGNIGYWSVVGREEGKGREGQGKDKFLFLLVALQNNSITCTTEAFANAH